MNVSTTEWGNPRDKNTVIGSTSSPKHEEMMAMLGLLASKKLAVGCSNTPNGVSVDPSLVNGSSSSANNSPRTGLPIMDSFRNQTGDGSGLSSHHGTNEPSTTNGSGMLSNSFPGQLCSFDGANCATPMGSLSSMNNLVQQMIMSPKNPSVPLDIALMMQQQAAAQQQVQQQQLQQQNTLGITRLSGDNSITSGNQIGSKRQRGWDSKNNNNSEDGEVIKCAALGCVDSSEMKKESPSASRRKQGMPLRNGNSFDRIPAIMVRYDKDMLGFDYAEEITELQRSSGFTERHGFFCMAITKALSAQLCSRFPGKTFAEIVQFLEQWDELPSPTQVQFVRKNRKGDGWYFRPSTLNCKYQCGDCRFEAVFACDVFHRLFHFRGDIQLRNTSSFIPPSTPQVTFRF